MDTNFNSIKVFFIACTVLLVSVIVGTVMGAIVGWIISFVPILNQLIYDGFNVFGFNAINKLPAIGAILGLISSFLFKNIGYPDQESNKQLNEILNEKPKNGYVN